MNREVSRVGWPTRDESVLDLTLAIGMFQSRKRDDCMLVFLEDGSCNELPIAIAVAGQFALFIDVVDMEGDGRSHSPYPCQQRRASDGAGGGFSHYDEGRWWLRCRY